MDEQSQQLAAELSQIGDRLCEIYEQLRQPGNQINIKLCDFLYFPKLKEDGDGYQLLMGDLGANWQQQQQVAIYQRQAEAARIREEQWEILREQRAAERKQLERDNIQTQINLINNEVVDLRALIQRHEGWRGGNVREKLAAIQRKIDDKMIEINQLKQQQEILSWML